MKYKPPFQFVCIEWEDIISAHLEWVHLEEAYKLRPPTAVTVGQLLEKTKQYVKVAATTCGEDAGLIETIPSGCIKKLYILRG